MKLSRKSAICHSRSGIFARFPFPIILTVFFCVWYYWITLCTLLFGNLLLLSASWISWANMSLCSLIDALGTTGIPFPETLIVIKSIFYHFLKFHWFLEGCHLFTSFLFLAQTGRHSLIWRLMRSHWSLAFPT